MDDGWMTLAAIGGFLKVSSERARQVANSDPTFPAPGHDRPRRWRRADVERWAESHWWDTLPTRKRPGEERRAPGFPDDRADDR
jgi:hypothetical protein